MLTVSALGRNTVTIPLQKNGLLEMEFPPAEEPCEVTLELSRTFKDSQGKEFGLAIIFEVR